MGLCHSMGIHCTRFSHGIYLHRLFTASIVSFHGRNVVLSRMGWERVMVLATKLRNLVREVAVRIKLGDDKDSKFTLALTALSLCQELAGSTCIQ